MAKAQLSAGAKERERAINKAYGDLAGAFKTYKLNEERRVREKQEDKDVFVEAMRKARAANVPWAKIVEASGGMTRQYLNQILKGER